jgi:DNA-binding NarL/FixJ family response regulator
MIKVLIVDDHPVVRRGLKQIIAEASDMVVAGEALSGQEALDKIGTDHWDVVLLDISMPDKSGLEVLKQVKIEQPKLPVLVLTVYPEDQYAVRVLKAGASGYLTKESAPEQLIAAIRKVAQGGKYISPLLAERLAGDLEVDTEKPRHEILSDREYQVMCLIASGKNLKEIAQEWHLSIKTINTYRARVMEKMKMKSNVEITRYVIKNHLLD